MLCALEVSLCIMAVGESMQSALCFVKSKVAIESSLPWYIIDHMGYRGEEKK